MDNELEEDTNSRTNGGRREADEGDSLQLGNSDHSGMSLVTVPLTGKNFLAWSRSVRIALGAKMKLGFIDGTIETPAKNSPQFVKWNRVNCMITLWILNSISKDIVDAFLYTNSAKELWSELEERFGGCNGPQLYQIQREICSITQGNQSISQY